MFELIKYRCPNCRAYIDAKLEDGKIYTCGSCRQQFRVLSDENTSRIGFVPIEDFQSVLPLGLPRGSIRAIATLSLSISCWLLILRGMTVPSYLLSLLLTIIGYYYGFRKKLTATGSHILDISAVEDQPLHLPAGFIRWFLILGFIICGMILYFEKRLADSDYMEFFIILMGLVAGYIYAKFFGRYRPPGSLAAGLAHVKGFAVMGISITLAVFFLFGLYEPYSMASLSMACIVSFYFGSRS